MTPVPDELWEMLATAESYAPAMALARNDMRRLQAASQTEFVEALMKSLRSHLAAQRDQRFFLALSRQTETGYRSAGSYYWIVGYRPDRQQREISWVSRDFYIYSDAVESFEVDVEHLNRLQWKPQS